MNAGATTGLKTSACSGQCAIGFYCPQQSCNQHTRIHTHAHAHTHIHTHRNTHNTHEHTHTHTHTYTCTHKQSVQLNTLVKLVIMEMLWQTRNRNAKELYVL